MRKYYELKSAIDYIEGHLAQRPEQIEVARAAGVSLSALQKLFRYSLGYGVGEYIVKRQMSEAAWRLVHDGASVTDLAFSCGYQNVESFSRAFRRVYGVLPSEYQRSASHGEIFTPVCPSEGGATRQSERLVEVLRSDGSAYVVCFDVADIVSINAISRQAGDAAISEALRRIRECANLGELAFRIGGDEFAVVTARRTASEAESFLRGVLDHNGEPFLFNGKKIPLTLRGWMGRSGSVAADVRPEETLRQNVKYQRGGGEADAGE